MNPNDPTHFSSEGIFKEEELPEDHAIETLLTKESRAQYLEQLKFEVIKFGWVEWKEKQFPFINHHHTGGVMDKARRHVDADTYGKIELFIGEKDASCHIKFHYVRLIDGKLFRQRDVLNFHFGEGRIHGILQRGAVEAFYRPFFFLHTPEVAMPYIFKVIQQSCFAFNECASRRALEIRPAGSAILKSLLFDPHRYHPLLKIHLGKLGWKKWSVRQKKNRIIKIMSTMKGEKNDSVVILQTEDCVQCNLVVNYSEEKLGQIFARQEKMEVVFTANKQAELRIEPVNFRGCLDWHSFPTAFKLFMKTAKMFTRTYHMHRIMNEFKSKEKKSE